MNLPSFFFNFFQGYAVRGHTLFITIGGMITQAYRARKPKNSPLWRCLFNHFDTFLDVYEERYQSRYGYLRPVIAEVVNKFLDCGNLERGFAHFRCDHCKHEFILAFSCKGRWFCPSCHQKKVQLFEEYLDFHPHLHGLVADGLLVRSDLFYLLPQVSLKPLEELFRARAITFLLEKGLLPPE